MYQNAIYFNSYVSNLHCSICSAPVWVSEGEGLQLSHRERSAVQRALPQCARGPGSAVFSDRRLFNVPNFTSGFRAPCKAPENDVTYKKPYREPFGRLARRSKSLVKFGNIGFASMGVASIVL